MNEINKANSSMAMAVENELICGLSNWVDEAKMAYDTEGNPSFLDANEQPIEGIYLGMPNDIYHALPAESSSKLKKFVDTPAAYFREYLSDVDNKRTAQQEQTFDTGTFCHELTLEPEGFYDKYFRDALPKDYPEALTTVQEIKSAIIKANGKPKGAKKDELIKQLMSLDEDAKVFEVIKENKRLSHGKPSEGKWEGRDVTLYGDKYPVDGLIWDIAHRFRDTTMAHASSALLLRDGAPEVAIIAKCPITGMLLKVKFDWLRFDDIAVDLKSARSSKPSKFVSQFYDLHYDVQQEFYRYVALLAGIQIDQFFFVATEYSALDACQPFLMAEKKVRKAKQKMLDELEKLNQCKSSGHWYGWCESEDVFVF